MQKAKQPTFTRQTDVWSPLTFARRRQTGYQCRREHISSRFWEYDKSDSLLDGTTNPYA